ncbi:hypothetical protein PAXRUDRAFT_702378 [Paxillus rubicundulus Ve08.2h10]|uniref:Arrestin C-terminal-like domain-containing protein n=1 Tax=Paxillus rubicundulus Ve08.2h10 TaxID=930991 RepID=A0A0D0E882_9AGAM|nr:hypothetical protein PAXRUDRAFT_702378 [Paxillus rubicundulus Ve08.2h10]
MLASESNSALSIRLTEPLVFLRSSDPSGRLPPDPNDPPALVRGLLTLNIAKPTRISSIEVELTGVATTNWLEGAGPRRIEVTTDHKIYSAASTLFRADHSPYVRRTVSVGPGLSLVNLNDHDDYPHSPRRGRSPDRRDVTASAGPSTFPSAVVNPERAPRRVSCDSSSFTRTGVDVRTGAGLGPSPPYTPSTWSPFVLQPSSGMPRSHTGSFGGGSTAAENPAQTLEELRQALRDNLEGQGYSHGQPSFSLPTPPRTHSCASSISNSSLQRDNDTAHGGTHIHHDDSTLSRHPSAEGEYSQTRASPLRGRPLNHTSSMRTSRTCSPDGTRTARSPDAGRDTSSTRSGRAYSRFSLSSVLDAVKEVATAARSRSRGFGVGEETDRGRGRTRVRVVVEEAERDGVDTDERDNNITGDHSRHFLGRVLGLDWDHDKEKGHEQGEGWKEFKRGTYTYPISFLLPPHLPPTLVRLYGTLGYTLKGVVHRPGTFTPKLSCHVPLLVVTAPSIGAGEGGGVGDPGPITVERQWEGRLAYIVGLSGRLFVIGSQRGLDADRPHPRPDSDSQVEPNTEAAHGTVTLDLTLMPLEKVKVWRVSVCIDEQISYLAGTGRTARDDGMQRVTLLEVQDDCSAEEISQTEETERYKTKHNDRDVTQIALLPTPLSPHRSPLLRYLPASADPSTLAGPGPYTLTATLGLPGCDSKSKLHFTVKQKDSNMRIEHTLRVMMRVEKIGDEGSNEPAKGENMKLFDIAVQTPITILSCRCAPEYQALPRYSRIPDSSQRQRACPCSSNSSGSRGEGHEHELHQAISNNSTTSSSEGRSMTGSGHDPREHVHINEQNERSDSYSSLRGRSRSTAPSNPGNLAFPLYPYYGLHARTQPHAHSEGAARSPSHTRSHLSPQDPSPSRAPQPRSQSLSISHMRPQTPTPHTSPPPSPLVQYERLVSGLESEAGEAPPSYESVAGFEPALTNGY